VLCYLSCLSSSVSCVWLCPTHIVLCYLSCLSSSCVLCMVVSNTRHRKTTNKTNNTTLYVFCFLFCISSSTQHYMCWTQPYTRHRRRQTRQITQHYMCWTQPYTRHRTTTKKTNNTTIHKTQTMTNRTNNTTLYVLDTTIHKTLDDDKQDK
jgi:hypothetical protein